jgi:hypothetical protein
MMKPSRTSRRQSGTSCPRLRMLILPTWYITQSNPLTDTLGLGSACQRCLTDICEKYKHPYLRQWALIPGMVVFKIACYLVLHTV